MAKENTATTFNGDLIDGIAVITKLNVDDLDMGKVYRFMFKGADMNIGQSWYVPLMVARGAKVGSKLLLNTGIHGDEMNGSRVIHKIFENLDISELSGTVIGVMQANPNGLMHVHRKWHLSTDGGDSVDMNRVFPGKIDGNAAQVHAYKLWNDLWGGNADYVVDLHTQSTDTEFGVFIYADYTIPGVQELAELIPANHIKIDSPQQAKPDNGGEISGAVENVFNAHGIPAITLELGGPRSYQMSAINPAVEGITNIMLSKKMLEGKIGKTAKDAETYIGKHMDTIKATAGGYAEIKVKIGEKVTQEQIVAIQRNPFGDIIQEYSALSDGVVASISTGATREPGATLVYILNK